MVDAKRAARRLTLAVAVLSIAAASCVGDSDSRLSTDPAPLLAPVNSCPSSQGSLQLPVWDLFVRDSAWEELHADVNADVEVDAQLCLNGVLEPIGIELQGASSRKRDKKSFKIKFAYDHALTDVGYNEPGDAEASIDKVFLKGFWGDQSLIREAVAFDLWREMGHTAPRTAYVNLRINGDYWGLYAIVEPVDKDYLRRYGYPAGGHLFKATRKNGSRADFAPGRNLVKAFEDKSNDTGEESRDDLERLITLLQDTELDMDSFQSEIDPQFRLDDYLDRMVWIAFTRNGDAVAQNYFLYNAPREDRDFWYQIPWDSDLCMGASWQDRNAVVAPDVSLMLNGEGNYFATRLLKVPDLSRRYADRFRHVLDHVLREPVVLNHLAQRSAHIRDDLHEDQMRWERKVGPDDAFDVIREFLIERPAVLRTEIEAMWPPSASGPLEAAAE